MTVCFGHVQYYCLFKSASIKGYGLKMKKEGMAEECRNGTRSVGVVASKIPANSICGCVLRFYWVMSIDSENDL